MVQVRRAALVLGLAALGGCATPAAAPDVSGIQAAITQAVQGGVVPGAIVVVHRNGQTLLSTAQGTADGMALAPSTVFWVASMTKPVVATTVMMLVEDGKLRLDDPVSRYIPEFSRPRLVRSLAPGSPPLPALRIGMPPDPNAPQPRYVLAPADRPLSVRDMITMTGGLQTIGVRNNGVPQVTDTDTIGSYVARLADAPLDFQPGSRWAYSNATEFEVLARIVEVASGQPYAAFVQSRVFDPLDMKDSHFGVRDDLRARTAPLGMMAHSPLRTGRFTSGSAGLWTTAEDYSHFAEMLLNDGVYNGKRLLQAATVQAMATNEIGALSLGGVNPSEYGGLTDRVNPGVKYGYGLMVVTDPAAAGVALPAGSFGWDGIGMRRFWVDRSDGLVLVMLFPTGDGARAQRAVEAATMQALGRH